MKYQNEYYHKLAGMQRILEKASIQALDTGKNHVSLEKAFYLIRNSLHV